MKTLLAATALALLVAVPAYAETATTTPKTEAAPQAAATTTIPAVKFYSERGDWRASNLMGLKVTNVANETIGDINEILFDNDGKIAAIVIGVGGFILPATYVDIISVEKRGDQMVGDTILERIQVLAVAQETFVEEGKAKLVRTVTMELSQRQAEKLAAQINQGPIHLVLRNPMDLNEQVVEVEEKPVVKRPVVRRAPAPKPEPAPAPFTIEVIQGDKKPETYKF